MKTNPENIKKPNRKPHSFFFREVKPVPNSASPPIGSNIA